MRFLITGHTGFKGAWLTMLLARKGHQLAGVALDPEADSLFVRADVRRNLSHDHRFDIRDASRFRNVVEDFRPDVIVHLAAQSLVRRSYREPHLTVDTNVMGTLSVLEALRTVSQVRAGVIITTDKVYRNTRKESGYNELDPLGGHDPYSSSKAMCELLVDSYVASFQLPPTATARAGNVIGGGDTSEDRLLPDLIRGLSRSSPTLIRNPSAIRPWQHVLDCLHGYEMLVNYVLDSADSSHWNFGPRPDSFRSVRELADLSCGTWGVRNGWVLDEAEQPHEAELLTLDATKARTVLGWDDTLSFEQAVEWTVGWEKSVANGASPRDVTLSQIDEYLRLSEATR